MPDKSAIPLPAPAGAKEGLTTKSVTIDWFNGEPREVDVCYVAASRIVALGKNVLNENAVPSVYGEWKDGIVTRTNQTSADFVAGRWLSSQRLVGETLLSRALEDFLPTLDEERLSLRIDDRAVLGLSDVADGARMDEQHWSVMVSGELTVPGLAEQILLRPAFVSLDNNILQFNEPGVAAGADELMLELTLYGPEAERRGPKVSLACAVSLLLDEKIDGAWERPSPLWLPTTSGLLRIGQGELERSPYRFYSESRNLDVRRWFPTLGAGASARLMLDQSGPKTLTVRRNDEGDTLTLKVQRPALVFVLPYLAVDGRDLAAPRRPPGAATMARAVPLQLVPVNLCGDSTSAWSLRFDTEMHLVWTRPGNPGMADLTHFTGHKNWVLPPESAVNDGPGISTLRVLIPMLPDGNTQQFRLSAVADDGAPAMRIEPINGFGNMAPEATDFGPLASFSRAVGQDKELWPKDAESVVPEPAVLRAAYRVLPPGVAVDGAPASFFTTRVRESTPSFEADLTPAVVTSEDKDSHRGWACRAGSKEAEQRYEHPADWPGEQFGWRDVRFLSPASVESWAKEAVPRALAWGQLQEEKDGKYTPTQWIRHSDDSLTRLTKTSEDTEESAIKALIDQNIVLELGTLADNVIQNRWGIAQLSMIERIGNGGSQYTLLVGGGPTPVTIELEKQRGVSRIVVADAQSRALTVDIAPAVTTASLNRIYLELERRGGRLVVTRGMLGWSASAAFGWNKKEDTELHITECFELNAGVLQRTIEFNGALSRQFVGANFVDLYFWDAVHKLGANSLRVICHYSLMQEQSTRSICALQDALLRDDESLDLSADIAILKNSGGDKNTSLSNPWDPDRRKLYRLQVDTWPVYYGFAGFLRIRSAKADSVTVQSVNTYEEARVIPAWFLCDRDLIPWFDTNSTLPSPDRESWTSAGLLRTGPVAVNNKELELKLYGVVGKWEQSYASTLIDTRGEEAGLPLWVPSPVRVPEAKDQAPTEAEHADALVPDALVRLWLFDPGPRMIAQWPITGGVVDPEKARQKALQRLWRMGWTREAVLEMPSAAPSEVEWEVVDSPLLNRGAPLAWFGWPLAPEAQYPSDVLPATRQVPQSSREGQHSYSVQVEFEHDLPTSESGVNLVHDSGNVQLNKKAPEGLTFRTGGMRIGVQHKIVAYGAEPLPAMPTALLNWPEQQKGAPLSLDGGWLTWKSETVDLSEARLMAFPDGVVQYTVPDPFNELRIPTEVPGLLWQNSDQVWVPIGENDWLKLVPVGDGSNVIRLKLLEPARWSALSVTLRTKIAEAPAPGEIKTLFPSGGTRLAGMFGKDDKLLAFGEEQAFYVAPQSPPLEGSSTWTRLTGIALSPGQAKAVKRIITIDLDGQTVESKIPESL